MNRLYSLQVGRGVAAVLVLLFHENLLFNSGKYFSHSPFGRMLSFGQAGVYFFFALSGFIIHYAHADDIGRSKTFFDYAKKE